MRAIVLLVTLCCCVRANGKREVVNWEDRLRALAGFQMNCDPEALQVLNLDRGWRAGVIGCGQRVAYEFDRWKGQWVAEPPQLVPLAMPLDAGA